MRVTAGRLLAFAALAAGLMPPSAGAEPYLAAFKGMHCSSCHSHPGGGGRRNAYGNVFAQTELAARPADPGRAFWTGAVTQWLSTGGDLRAAYEYVDTPGRDSLAEFRVVRGAVYGEATLAGGRVGVYVDQQFAPGSSINREAYLRLNSADRRYWMAAGQFYLPYGLRLQDDEAFIRATTGVNFTAPDRGLQAGYESGPVSAILSVGNGTGGGSEIDSGKQWSFIANFVRNRWRAGVSVNDNNADAGDRLMYGVFGGLRTGDVVWLAEADVIVDELPGMPDRDAIATLVEANWLIRDGHNIKLTYEYFDPDRDLSENHQVRGSLIWEYNPLPFVQGRFGARIYDGIPSAPRQNRDEYFAELHGFF